MISLDQLKQLREATGVSVVECKKALEEAAGDIDKAKEILRKWGQNFAVKRTGREVCQGVVESYIHPNGKLGVLIELKCESDFVARAEDFKGLAHEICLQIAAMNPSFIKPEDVPDDVLEKERSIYAEQLKKSGKPENIVKKIIEEKLKNYKIENSLLSQAWVKENKKTIKELIDEYIAKLGENIILAKFVRYEL